MRGSTLGQVGAVLPGLVADCAAILPTDPRVVALKRFSDAGNAVDEQPQALLADTLESVYVTSGPELLLSIWLASEELFPARSTGRLSPLRRPSASCC